MYAIIEITKYPLTPDYETPILDFIGRLKSHEEFDMTVGETSTVIRGDYDRLMEVLQKEIKTSLSAGIRTSFVLKVLNTENAAV